ncbi:MAG: DoxX family protein [Euzebya sp.]
MKMADIARRVPLGVGLLATVMVAAGVLHFVAPKPYDSIIPRVLPDAYRRPLTYASGVAEMTVGVMMLVPRTRRLGAQLTALLLVAVWPANIDAALRGGYPGLDGFFGTPTAAWLRVPLQLPLILWAAWLARRSSPPPTTSRTTPA